ncbi:MAG: Tfp pilus assembly protein PilB [Candidatus Azambacteria bacterium GW2011_GWD2_46_48]|uniref:Tfp pilus assembly protein PilB n=1 Tax=Candidatus Azambacteria bacterium GW2011_GWD2_46_48 TaxID=1618623 RepID=A0A0G1T3Z1_9BACT|nr:MAG: Tfp pilus assembly protein PilB [Candidatus Azambacteria bacterium GW2011_GWD2_46_48]
MTQLEEAEKKSIQSGKKLGEVLVEEKIIGEEDLIKLQAYILGVPYVNLEKEKIDPRVLQIIPEPIARTHNIVAYKKAGQTLEVAMLDPEDLQTIEFIKKTANLKIRPRLASPASIQTILKQYQKSLEVEFGEIIKKETPALTAYAEEERAILAEEGEDLKKIAEDLPIIKIVDTPFCKRLRTFTLNRAKKK